MKNLAKKMKKEQRAITLISLVITIVILLILATIGIGAGIETINSSKLTKFNTEMKIMQLKANEWYDEYNSAKSDEEKQEIINRGESIVSGEGQSEVVKQANKVFSLEESGIVFNDTDQIREDYRYYSNQKLKNLGVDGVEQDFFVNIKNRTVVSYEGLSYKGEMYYTISQLPQMDIYNVDYESQSDVEFDLETKISEDGKQELYVKNIKSNGYINKWQIRYKLKEDTEWKTTETFKGSEYTVKVDKSGLYEVQVFNDNDIFSEIKESGINIVTDNLFLYYDAKLNAGNNHNASTTTWKDLSGNNRDGTVIGTPTWEEDKLIFDGVDDYIDTGIIQNDLGQSITIQTIVNFQEIANYRGIYGYHSAGGSTYIGIMSQCNGDKIQFAMYTGSSTGTAEIEIDKNILYNKNVQITVVMEGKKGIKLYLNGKLYGEMSTTESLNLYTNMNFVIAKSFNDDNRYFKGTMSNFRVYKKALTDSEIQQNYKADIQRYDLDTIE